MLKLEFMRLAFAAGSIVGLLAPAVGFFLVQRRMGLIGDGIGHTAFAGVAAGYLLGVSPVPMALAAAVGGAVGVEWLRARRTTAGDQALALLFYTGIAAGVVLLSAAEALDAGLFTYLFGSILTVTRGDLVLVAVLGLAGLAAIVLAATMAASVAPAASRTEIAANCAAPANVVADMTTAAPGLIPAASARRPNEAAVNSPKAGTCRSHRSSTAWILAAPSENALSST